MPIIHKRKSDNYLRYFGPNLRLLQITLTIKNAAVASEIEKLAQSCGSSNLVELRIMIFNIATLRLLSDKKSPFKKLSKISILYRPGNYNEFFWPDLLSQWPNITFEAGHPKRVHAQIVRL